jgi:hypothetical protein
MLVCKVNQNLCEGNWCTSVSGLFIRQALSAGGCRSSAVSLNQTILIADSRFMHTISPPPLTCWLQTIPPLFLIGCYLKNSGLTPYPHACLSSVARGVRSGGLRVVCLIKCLIDGQQDFGSRDPTPGELASNFSDKVVGNWDTSHIIRCGLALDPHRGRTPATSLLKC